MNGKKKQQKSKVETKKICALVGRGKQIYIMHLVSTFACKNINISRCFNFSSTALLSVLHAILCWFGVVLIMHALKLE